MFKTLSVKNSTDKYNDKIQKHNGEVVKKRYQDALGIKSYLNPGTYKEECMFCFSFKVERSNGEISKIKMVYLKDDISKYRESNFIPDMMIGGDIYDREPEEAVQAFCSKYGEALLNNCSIEELAITDPDNIINYQPEKHLTKKKKR